MDSTNLVKSFADFARSKNIDRPTVIRILEDVFRVLIINKFGSGSHFDIIINLDKGDLQIWRLREIVDDHDPEVDSLGKVALSEARKIEKDFELGEELSEEISLSIFNRKAVQAAKQVLVQKVRALEKEALYEKYKAAVGTLISVKVHQILGKEVILLDEDYNELILPKSEQIPKDYFKKGEMVRAIVHKILFSSTVFKIILSRTSDLFLERLLEHEIPEISDGVILVKKVAREPGFRAKVSVESLDDRIDPVGACVGIKGSRIHGITKELRFENIDVVNYTQNVELYISRALSPACVNRIEQGQGRLSVYLDPDQIALAIGKFGQNIKLASKLIGLEIDIYRDTPSTLEQDDLPLSYFREHLGEDVLNALHEIGLESVNHVLNASKELMSQHTKLDLEKIEQICILLNQGIESSDGN